MIIKSADDKQPQLETLQALAATGSIDAATRRRIEQEIRNIRAGMRGEGEAAYEMQVRYGQSLNWMVIHDLRLEHDGLVAQIDHLIINRFLEIWACESKHFAEGVAINEHGEFAAFFGGKPYGVPSPIEQNNRHILILQRLFDSSTVKLPSRMGFTIKPTLKGLVLVSKGARIARPKAKIDGLDTIIKNDMLFKAIDKALDDSSPLLMAKVVGRDTVEHLARQIAALHRPAEFNWHAKFGLPLVTPKAPDLPQGGNRVQAAEPQASQHAGNSGAAPNTQKWACACCGTPVPRNVARFCWFNKARFSNQIYCLNCQGRY